MYFDIRFWTQERLQRGLEKAQDELEKIFFTTSKTIQGQTFQKQQIMDMEELITAYQIALGEISNCQDASVVKPYQVV
jgi:cob(I)alamin adenosyltransferase